MSNETRAKVREAIHHPSPGGAGLLLLIKNSIVGTPGTFLQPFALQAIRLVGGELNMLRLHAVITAVTSLLKYLVGYNSLENLVYDIVNK